MASTRNVAPVWSIPVRIGDAFSYLLLLDELTRENRRRFEGEAHAFVGRLRGFQAELALAADERRRASLDSIRVTEFALGHAPPYLIHAYRRGNGAVVYAQVTWALEQRVAVELMDLVRLSPSLSRCSRCGRVQTRRHCHAYLFRPDGLIIETCDGETSAPDLDDERRRRKRAMKQKMWRYKKAWGAGDPRFKRVQAQYQYEFRPEPRGPAPRTARSNILPSDQPRG